MATLTFLDRMNDGTVTPCIFVEPGVIGYGGNTTVIYEDRPIVVAYFSGSVTLTI